MNNQPNLINFLQQGISEHLRQMELSAQLGRELYKLLQDHIQETRGILVWEKTDYVCRVDRDGLVLFESVSLAACFEFALKQPVKAGSDEPK